MRAEQYRPDLRMLEHIRLPDGWMWGAGQSAYQTEGGINTADGPRNDWFRWESEGRVERTGVACDFWQQPELILDRVAAAGLNCLRISIEWARVEPSSGRIDAAALDRYVEIVAAARSRGIDLHVCAWHFTHPQWLGPEPWLLDPDGTRERFAAHVETVAAHLGEGLERRGLAPPRMWLTMNEINILPTVAYLFGGMPPGRTGQLADALAMFDALGQAHVSAYHAIHRTYVEHGWPAPMVSTNNSAVAVYELDFFLLDLLTGTPDVERHAQAFADQVAAAPRAETGPVPRLFQLTSRRTMRRARRLGMLSGTAEAVRRDGTALDWVAADWYTPFLTDFLRRPGRRAAPGTRRGSRAWGPQLELWEQRPNPAGVRWYLNRCGDYGLPVVLVESGMCSPGWARRPDGWDRETFLCANIEAVLGALADGVPMRGYLHWSMTDNYEWGTYRPRFGLHGADRDAGIVRIAETDAMGDRPAEAYRRIVSAWTADGSPDPAAIRAAFANPRARSRPVPP